MDIIKKIRALAKQPVNTTDNREFTTPKIRNIIENMKNRATGEDVISSEGGYIQCTEGR